jgi:hypothetical protein
MSLKNKSFQPLASQRSDAPGATGRNIPVYFYWSSHEQIC